ncbi:MAG: SPASM domain-containing protein [Planctomycetota bacterium]|nr:MAG: SPASM domain-containing protein [Planctomycetota bacterium]
MGSYSGLGEKGAPGVNLYAEPFFRENGFTRVPVLVQWMATLRCSFSCVHCLCGDAAFDNEMTFDEVRGLIGQIAELGVCELLVTGGEPLERPDMPEIIRLLGASGVRWSLNTAAFPDAACRNAMEACPPSFVAVSLDGPERVHDSIRKKDGAFEEALRAISYFSRITGGRTTAGTTVHRMNINHLAETFPIVIESGATAWGIHLLFREGKAAENPDLFPTRKQLKKLLSFIASKRKYFPVGLADELGYAGEWEPLVRDHPLWCGAGRAQCVVLPDGEVVPCTTLERSESAGNIRSRPLREIWETGFSRIRTYIPEGKCAKCDYAPACGGGCWLQRRHGLHCFRDVWSKPRSLLTAAGLAVCLGLSACTGDEKTAAGKTAAASQAVQAAGTAKPGSGAHEIIEPQSPAVLIKISKDASVDLLEWSIAQWYAKVVLNKPVDELKSIREPTEKLMPRDPAAKYFLDFMDGKRPKKLAEKAKLIHRCLETDQRALSLSSLLWREISEWCLDSKPAVERTEEERKLVRETIRAIAKQTEKWRTEIFHRKLDPFFHRNALIGKHHMAFKGGPRVAPTDAAILSLAAEHWYNFPNAYVINPGRMTEEYLSKNPFGLSMRVGFKVIKGPGITRILPGENEKITGEGRLEIFDIVKSEKGADGSGTTIRLGPMKKPFDVVLPPGIELTYADVLRLAYEQNREEIDKWAAGAVKSRFIFSQPLLLPALREMSRRKASEPDSAKIAVKLLNQWMF